MVRRNSPTVRNRELGALLKGYREARNLSATQVASDLLISPATISRLETASRASPRSGPLLVRALCGYYALDPETTARLVQMAKEGSQPGWWQRYNLEPATATYLDLESAAASIENFETTFVPGLLQTMDYAKEVIQSMRPNFSADQLDRTVESRLARQQILTGDNPLSYHAVVDEAIFHRVVGNREVMRNQLQEIRRIASELHHVTIQVLPFSAGVSPGVDGPFAVLSFPEVVLPPVVYAEGQLGQVFNHDPDVAERARLVFSGLSSRALDPDQSLGVIDERIRSFS